MNSYVEMLKQLAKKKFVSEASSIFDETNTTASIQYVPDVKPSDVYHPVFQPEYNIYPYDDSLDEDLIEDYSDMERILRNPGLSVQEVFDLVYKLITDDEYELEGDKVLKLVGIALDRFFESLAIDAPYVIEKPYQLFFAIYKYFFVTYAIETLAIAILLMFIAKHPNYKTIYLKPFANLTLNNQKSINGLLAAARYVPVEELIEVSKDDDFHEYFTKFLKRISTEKDILMIFGIDKSDYELLLPYLIEDDNTIDALFRQILNTGSGELCKFQCIALLTGNGAESSEEDVSDEQTS